MLVSLAIGMPFTLQYAREQTPREFWATPQFKSANRLISLVWAAALAILVAADAAAEYAPSVPIWIDVTATVAAFLGALGFTIWYPAKLRRQAQARTSP